MSLSSTWSLSFWPNNVVGDSREMREREREREGERERERERERGREGGRLRKKIEGN